LAFPLAVFVLLLFGGALSLWDPGAEAEAADPCAGCARVLEAQASSDTSEALSVTLVMDRPVLPKVFTLQNPPRLVLDVEPAWMERVSALASWGHPLLRGTIRSAWHPDSRRLRLVLDLHPGVKYEVQQDLYLGQGSMGEGARFVLRLEHVPPK